jgi:hypothetical protein
MLFEELDKLDKEYRSMMSLWHTLEELKLLHKQQGADIAGLNMWMRQVTLAQQENRHSVLRARIAHNTLLTQDNARARAQRFAALFSETQDCYFEKR